MEFSEVLFKVVLDLLQGLFKCANQILQALYLSVENVHVSIRIVLSAKSFAVFLIFALIDDILVSPELFPILLPGHYSLSRGQENPLVQKKELFEDIVVLEVKQLEIVLLDMLTELSAEGYHLPIDVDVQLTIEVTEHAERALVETDYVLLHEGKIVDQLQHHLIDGHRIDFNIGLVETI